jgi:hypothetical protein
VLGSHYFFCHPIRDWGVLSVSSVEYPTEPYRGRQAPTIFFQSWKVKKAQQSGVAILFLSFGVVDKRHSKHLLLVAFTLIIGK